jgi:potassium efflux system protein
MISIKAVTRLLTLFIMMASAGVVLGEGPSSPAPAQSSLPNPPAAGERDPGAPTAPFAPIESATHAESMSISLRGIEADLNNDPVTSSIESQLKILTTEIDARMDESLKLLASNPSLQLLGTQEQEWSGIERELDQWTQSLQRRTDQLKSARSLLQTSASTWEQEQALTEYYLKWHNDKEVVQLVMQAELPIQKTRDAIQHTSADLNITMRHVASVRLAVDLQDARVLDVLDSTRRARDEAFSRLFVQDKPMWDPSLRSQGNHWMIDQGRDSLGRQLKAVGAYIKRRRENIALQAVMLIALAAMLRWIQSRAHEWIARDPDLEKPTRVFASPFASALLICLLFSGTIYPQAPRLFWAIIGAAALIPTVIILRRLIDRRWFSILDALVVFYFLDQLRSIAAAIPALARMLLLIEMLGGFLLLISFLRSVDRAEMSDRARKSIRTLTLIWMGAFVAASIGTVIGYVSLAELIGNGALGSSYLAVILYACTLILHGLIIIALRSRPLVMLKMVREYRLVMLKRLTRALNWLAIVAWGLGVLASLSVMSAAYEIAHQVLGAQLKIGSLHVSLGDVLKFSLTVWGSIILSRFLRFVLEEDIYDRFRLPSGIPYAISKLLNYVVLLLGFFVAVSALGYDMTKFTILAGAFGVGLGFGMQNIVNNFVSGLILLFERPVKVGDVIQMGDTTGVVVHIGIRASIIRTHDSSEIIVPNGNLISSQVTNWTLSNRQRGVDIDMSLGADADPAKVIGILKAVAAANPRVTRSPAPEVYLTKFGADSFSYHMTAWTENAEQWIQIRSELAVALNHELVKEKIAIK